MHIYVFVCVSMYMCMLIDVSSHAHMCLFVWRPYAGVSMSSSVLCWIRTVQYSVRCHCKHYFCKTCATNSNDTTWTWKVLIQHRTRSLDFIIISISLWAEAHKHELYLKLSFPVYLTFHIVHPHTALLFFSCNRMLSV